MKYCESTKPALISGKTNISKTIFAKGEEILTLKHKADLQKAP